MFGMNAECTFPTLEQEEVVNVLLHAVIVAVVTVPYFIVVCSAEFRGGWRLAVDIAMAIAFLIGSIVALAISQVDGIMYGPDQVVWIVSGAGLTIMAACKILFLIIAPFFPTRAATEN